MSKEERDFKKVRLIIVMSASLVILAFIVGIFLGADINPPKDLKEPKVVDKKETEKEAKKETELRSGYDIKEVIYDTSSRGNDSVEKVELTTDGRILVSIIDKNEIIVNRLEVEKGVDKYYLVHVNQSDYCEGNTRLILDQGYVYYYMNIDSLVCAHRIIEEKINTIGMGSIVNIEEEKKQYSEDEPYSYTVYAVDSNGNKTDISDKIY